MSDEHTGPRERRFLERAAMAWPDGLETYLADPLTQRFRRDRRRLDALEEALNGWEYAAQYKGEFLAKKHGDAEDIARLRALLKEADEDDDD